MSGTVKDLKVWQESVGLAADVVKAVRSAARRETRGFTDELLSCAASVPVIIADACGRYSAAEQRMCYRAARRALLALETRLAIARHSGLLSSTVTAQLAGRLTSVSRLLGGYLAYLERQMDAESRTASVAG